MRLNLYNLKRPEPVEATHTFTDDLQPGAEITLAIRSTGDYNEDLKIGELAGRHIEEFVTNKTPMILPNLGTVDMTGSLCNVVAALEILQVSKDGAAPYDFAELCAMTVVMPNAFRQISSWGGMIREQAKGKLKNAPREDTDTASEPPLVTEP